MTTMTLPRARGDHKIHNADYLLGMPAAAPEAEALEQDRARRVVQRLAGQDTAELLDMLGLAIPEPPGTQPPPSPTKRCSRCTEVKPRSEFTKAAKSGDGLYSQCRTCHRAVNNKSRRKLYAERGSRSMPGGDQNITWKTASPGGSGMPCTPAAVEARIATWKELRVDKRMDPRPAAERMQVSMRSARRWDRILKDRGLLPQTDGAEQAVTAE
jgi:hypothetical protein